MKVLCKACRIPGNEGGCHDDIRIYDGGRDQRLPVPGERIEHADGRRELLIP